jgi:hypothetical protein
MNYMKKREQLHNLSIMNCAFSWNENELHQEIIAITEEQ